jgi:hypothetical protein
MQFARKEPRVSVSCQGAVKPGRTDTTIGRVVDLSQHGMGVQLGKFTAPGTRVHIRLDPRVFSDPVPAGDLPEITGLVMHCVREPSSDSYRLGVFVPQMPERLRHHIRDVASPTAMIIVRDDAVKTSSPRVREALYQAACARLDTRQPEAALRAAERALAADPENRMYRAMVHRCRAEIALSKRNHGAAGWEIEKAWAFAPRDPRILVLRERVLGRH